MIFILLFISILTFFLGASLGSFINMIVYRINKRQSIFIARSFNDYTGKPLEWKDLIPVFSFLVYKGKDRATGKKLPVVYPVIEFILGSASTLLFLAILKSTFEPTDLLVKYAVSTYLLTGVFAIAVYDYLYQKIERSLLYFLLSGVMLAHTLNIFFKGLIPEINTITILVGLAFLTAGYLIIFFSKGKGFTAEDSIFLALLGLLLGLKYGLLMLVIAINSALLIALIKIVYTKKFSKDDTIVFAPFLAFATLLCFLLFYTK